MQCDKIFGSSRGEKIAMKRIVITGKNSFTGRALTEWLSRWPEKYHVDTMSLRDNIGSFSGYDVVVHVAGIAHDSTRTADKEQYYRVNTQLTHDTAQKARHDGVKQFVFMSSSIVYGTSAGIGQQKIITRDTPINPESYYGESKAQAESLITPLDDEKFHVCILRCPMIYGEGCKGNYPVLSKIARKLPVFPKVNNARSMLYVKNFAEFVRLLVDDDAHGIFWPQNGEYSNTSELVKMIAEVHHRKIVLIPGCELPLKVCAKISGLVNKAFGSLTYDMSLSSYRENYRVYDLRRSIELTERI